MSTTTKAKKSTKPYVKGTRLDRERVEMIVEDAGMYISYWAVSADWNVDARTYTITIDPDLVDESTPPVVTLTYRQIARAAFAACLDSRAAREAAFADDDEIAVRDYDAAGADYIIQVAAFGTVTFG